MVDKEVQLLDLQRQIKKLTELTATLVGDRSVPTFAEFAAQYLGTKLKNPTLRESTKSSFCTQVSKHLIPGFGALGVDKIGNAEWLTWVTAQGKRSFFNARKALIEILNAAKEAGFLDKLPRLDQPDEKHDVGRALSNREVFRLLKACKPKWFRLFVYTMFKMGIRPREILQWDWSMFEWSEPGHTWINIPGRITKTGRARRIPVSPNVSRRLFLIIGRSAGPPGQLRVFPTTEYHHLWAMACKRSGVQAVAYDMRRTFLTNCAAAGMPLLYVARAVDTSVKLLEQCYAKAAADAMESIVK